MNSTVNIHITNRHGMSHLASAYFTPPFKIADITEDKQDPTLHLMLMSSSPGILDGDEQSLNISLDTYSRLHLYTQSYQRLFTMKTGATQSMKVDIGPGARFCWLPHPAVPHAGSIFKSYNKIVLNPGSQLIWGEVLTCGRKLTGEVFALSVYHSRTEFIVDNRLALLENQYLNPAALPVNTFGQLEYFTHQASLITTETHSRKDIENFLGILTGPLTAQPNPLTAQPHLLAGITEGPAGFLVIRLLGHAAEHLHATLKAIACLIQNLSSVCQPN